MTITVGGKEMAARRWGTTEIAKVMVEDQQIWPPVQTVQYVASTVAVSSSNTINAHQIGDLLVVQAVSTSTTATTPPALPAGWTNAYVSVNDNMAVRIGWRIATTNTTTSGTWTGANCITTYVFRNTDTTAPFGVIASAYSSGPVSPAVTPTNDGSGVLVYSHTQNQSVGSFTTNPPAGMIAKNRTSAMCNSQRRNSRVGASLTDSHTSTNSLWRNTVFEVLPPAPVTAEPQYMYDVTFEYLANYEVQFHIKKGYTYTAADGDEIIFLTSVTGGGSTGPSGYCSRDPKFTFFQSAQPFTCTFEDRTGIPGDPTSLKTIAVTVYPRAAALAGGITAADAPVGAIKGNADSGLYHTPDSPFYDQTIAEQWFTTEAEAKAAGFIKYVRKTTRKPRKKA